MLRKSNQSFGPLPAIVRRVRCDFDAVRGRRPEPVAVRHVRGFSSFRNPPSNFLDFARDFSRYGVGKNPIRLGWIGFMRGAVSRKKRCGEYRPFAQRSNTGRRVMGSAARKTQRANSCISVSAGCAVDFFLFYLTAWSFFDNRHGLLKKLCSARTAETLSAVKPRD